MPVEPTPAQRRLAARLQSFADARRVTGRDLAAALGVSTSTVSRIGRGERVPSDDEVARWLARCGVNAPAHLEEVRALHDAAVVSGHRWADEDPAALQESTNARVRAARLVCSYQPAILPGLLQTAAYATRVLEADPAVTDVAGQVARRLQGQDALYERGRRFVFVIAAHVLERDVGDPAGVDAQRARLANVSSLDTVDVLVLPDPAAALGPMVPFTLFDEADDGPVVVVELPHGDVQVTGAGDVEVYREAFASLRSAARPLEG